ncbi:family 10 glycosylhydrolase [Paenibacillus jiagnxiensis]|uniref:family 10 glycosylhydrolase n=1 Tax=Paenibacillus jiagnxiensis TaxID=3228926 RepID=UPI0033B85AC7
MSDVMQPDDSNTERVWWNQPLRIIQPNMQVKDTGRIDPERLAHQMKELGANAMVFNTGGIYAWYRSEVPFHTVNSDLPAGRDLLQEMIRSCHKHGIRFIARFDFSKAEDSVCLQRPYWFVRRQDGSPDIIGAQRPGAWPLLMSTCINGGYRNEDVAVPVLKEALQRYDIDGVFFNAPGYVFCRCAHCRRKYRDLYGKELPEVSTELESDFPARCFDDNLGAMYRTVKETRSEVPMILYYNLYRDHLENRLQITDMLCTEPQDILSLGHTHIPEAWKPALSIKVGRSVPGRTDPFGIVHSCPGMDWRHTGLPPAEYSFWLAQIPANGGQIWHSLTGIPDTITDKRILRTVRELNVNAAKVAPYMDGALPEAQTVLLWNADRSAEGWADALINKQIPFHVLLPEQAEKLQPERQQLLLLPEGSSYSPAFIDSLREYVRGGGCILVEGKLPEPEHGQGLHDLHDLLGISSDGGESEYLYASYLRFEGQSNPLQSGLEETELIPHRGEVTYCFPDGDSARVLATLVPPFSPLESVGAPPERASLPVVRTELPLAILNEYGAGKTLYFPFSLSKLIHEFKLEEHYRLFSNAVHFLLDGKPMVTVTSFQGLQVTLFRKDNSLLIHLVNGAGRRPLATALPLHNIEVKVRLPAGSAAGQIERLIGGGVLEGIHEDGSVRFTLPRLDIWECVRVSCLI